MKSPFYKSKQRIEQDLSRNAIADYESGDKKAAKYEKKEELEVAAGEGPKMMGKGGDKSPLMKKGSFMSKHCSSSPAKMYGNSPAKETIAQEKKNLMDNMPVDKKASALRMYGKKK
mgnify:FL=1|tara:strand:+ start:296 stop:643 length:348 start_codon:yes stop_codon:yes gene_type:complete